MGEPFTLFTEKISAPDDAKPYQVMVSAEFHDQGVFNRLLAMAKDRPRLCVLYRERFMYTFKIKKEKKYTFDMVYRNDKIDYTEQTLLNLLEENEWLYKFEEERLQEEFCKDGMQTMEDFLLKANRLIQENNTY
ncbi:hypothetical protein [Geomicrobium sp. JCM 19039]|uniref:hypothetical protein n=1 Tax=Geomicrobium sp. JCM 19039 TaxID=1460636 RepID=UPI00045F29EF|nr:hypothetical protein [Geomicrobium sp. JCM 19039]GAK13680.1 hypothetical protein JCM19039_3547 [Geomicrobium sp. JCM 19039]